LFLGLEIKGVEHPNWQEEMKKIVSKISVKRNERHE